MKIKLILLTALMLAGCRTPVPTRLPPVQYAPDQSPTIAPYHAN